MFHYAKVFNGELSKWDVSAVTEHASMFHYAKVFNGDVSKWDVMVSLNSGNMFHCLDFNSGMNVKLECQRQSPT